ncbi:hypothetical protein P879_09102 [Paragonimus westermani]|uniref:Uncharacterized protein n=1 Tax=Paragonimus westermani TaxID=34504 RepID=A0A8T0DEL6_9TREM|nr:hypothetical protein P879_09102 [Paragonimus westermani]
MTLQSIHVGLRNIIYAQHVLATCNQDFGEKLDQLVRQLKSLASECTFKTIIDEEQRNEALRDSFISGIQSIAHEPEIVRTKYINVPNCLRPGTITGHGVPSISDTQQSFGSLLFRRESLVAEQFKTRCNGLFTVMG